MLRRLAGMQPKSSPRETPRDTGSVFRRFVFGILLKCVRTCPEIVLSRFDSLIQDFREPSRGRSVTADNGVKNHPPWAIAGVGLQTDLKTLPARTRAFQPDGVPAFPRRQSNHLGTVYMQGTAQAETARGEDELFHTLLFVFAGHQQVNDSRDPSSGSYGRQGQTDPAGGEPYGYEERRAECPAGGNA